MSSRLPWLRLLIALMLALGTSTAWADSGRGRDDDRPDDDLDSDDYRAHQVVVRLEPEASIDDFNAEHETSVIAQEPSRDLYLLRLPRAVDEEKFEEMVEEEPSIDWAELNYTNQVPEGRPRRFFVSGKPDPGEIDKPYAPRLLGVPLAADCTTGKGVIVAVIDTGIDASHPALRNHVGDGVNVLDPTKGVADVGDGKDNDRDGLVDEMKGHGTHVAGIVLQAAPNATIMPIKALDSDGAGDAFYLGLAIYHAIDHGADVINLSLGSTYDAKIVEEAVEEAIDAGIVVAAAAGNENRRRPVEYPAANAGVVGVAATNADDKKTWFSNFNARVRLSAPGSKIVSAFPGGRFRAWSGTSMATAWVSGAAALLLSTEPDWTAAEAVPRLRTTAVDLDRKNPDYVGLLGSGRLDVAAAVGCGGGG